jgi:hypothetical protein
MLRGLIATALATLLIAGWEGGQAQTQPQRDANPAIQFGKTRITGHVRYLAESQPKTRTYRLKLFRGKQQPVRIEAPDQYLVIEANYLQAQFGYNEQNEPILQQAIADQGVSVRYARPKPFSRLDARARKATYNAEQSMLTLEGDVYLEAEDEFYKTVARNHERVVVYLEEESQRLEAYAIERDGIPRGEIIITPKEQRPK